MNKPNVSPNFTIEDIHNIRAYNYERRKNMTVKESIADTQKGAEKVIEMMLKLKQKNTKYS